jgi:hypothetical protein
MKATKRPLRLLALLTVLAAAPSLPVWALGPVDGEVTALYWLSDTEVGDVSESSSAVSGRAELWFVKKFGVSAALYQPDPEDSLEGTDFDYKNIDFKWRLLSPTENNFLAIGAGWQQADYDDNGVEADTSGPRLVAEGRVGIVGMLYFYGRGAYLPDLDDMEVGLVTFTDGKGHELEFGVQLKPMPFVQFFGGYRTQEESFEGPFGNDIDLKHDGFVVGAGFNF